MHWFLAFFSIFFDANYADCADFLAALRHFGDAQCRQAQCKLRQKDTKKLDADSADYMKLTKIFNRSAILLSQAG